MRILRPINLILLALFLYSVGYAFVGEEVFNVKFHWFVLNTLLIASVGYLWNNYKDHLVDKENNSSELKKVNKQLVYVLSIVFILGAISISFYIGSIEYVLLITVLPLLLLFIYNPILKLSGFIGNLIIAFLSSYSIFLAVYIVKGIDILIMDMNHKVFMLFIVLASALITLAREVIKDCEDRIGDELGLRRTLPIIRGASKSHFVAQFCWVIVVLLSVLLVVFYGYNNFIISSLFVINGIVSLVQLWRLNSRFFLEKEQYKILSFQYKLQMLLTPVFCIVVNMTL